MSAPPPPPPPPGDWRSDEAICRLFELKEAEVLAIASTTSDQLTLAAIARTDNWGCRRAALENPALHEETLREFARSREADDRCSVAGNPSVPLDVWICLAADSSVGPRGTPRGFAAGNETWTDENMVRRVAQQAERDGDAHTLHLVARSLRTPDDLVAELAEHSHAWVRLGAAMNHSLPTETLWQLTHDFDREIKAAADFTLQLRFQYLGQLERLLHEVTVKPADQFDWASW